LTPIALAALAIALSACGGGKPAYCSKVSDLKKSVQNLSNTTGVSDLKTRLEQIGSQAQSVVSSAKSDFPNETAALSSSVNALETTVKQLSSSPSPSQLTTVAGQASAVVTSLKNLSNATSSKCS
jgi:hypothetical protein